MGRKEIELEAERLLEPALKQLGIELIDVEYVRERNWILRVFIDKEGGVDLNDCQQISEKAGELLDEADLISANYMLEVSSPGLDRVLKKDKDFLRYAGEEVDVKLFAPLEEVGGVKPLLLYCTDFLMMGRLCSSFRINRSPLEKIRFHK